MLQRDLLVYEFLKERKIPRAYLMAGGYGESSWQVYTQFLEWALSDNLDLDTRSVLFAPRPFNEMEKSDRIRACYLHACLKCVNRDYMTNTTLRQRFGIEPKNSAIASRIIRETMDAGFVRPYEIQMSKKYSKYLPFWA